MTPAFLFAADLRWAATRQVLSVCRWPWGWLSSRARGLSKNQVGVVSTQLLGPQGGIWPHLPHRLKQADSGATDSWVISGPPTPSGPYLTCFHGAAVPLVTRRHLLLASLGQCRSGALGLGWAVLASWASAPDSNHTRSSAVRHWAQWVCRRRLAPAWWNWVMVARWTWRWAADWSQASRTLGEREEPTPKAIRAWASALVSALQEVR